MRKRKSMQNMTTAEFMEFSENFAQKAQNYAGELGIPSLAVDKLQIAIEQLRGYLDDIAKGDRSPEKYTIKDLQRKDTEKQISKITRMYITDNEKTTDAILRAFGLPIPDKTKTPVHVPETHPILICKNNGYLELHVYFYDETDPNHRGKPVNVDGLQLFINKSGTPEKTEDYRVVANCTKSPHLLTFEAEERGNIYHLKGRWFHNDEVGIWSQPISFVVG
jgi:hypothetical protein